MTTITNRTKLTKNELALELNRILDKARLGYGSKGLDNTLEKLLVNDCHIVVGVFAKLRHPIDYVMGLASMKHKSDIYTVFDDYMDLIESQ